MRYECTRDVWNTTKPPCTLFSLLQKFFCNVLFLYFFFFKHLSFFFFLSCDKKQVSGKASISVMFTKNCESIRLMFEYQTTGTHLMLFCAEVLLVNAREELCGCVGGGPSFIGGWRTCVLGRRHCSRRQGAALRHPNRGVRRPSLGNLRCCASWAWLGGRSQTRALGLGLRAGGSTGVPTAPPSGGGKKCGC